MVGGRAHYLKPRCCFGDRITIKEQACKEKTEEHDQAPDEIRHAAVFEHNANKQANSGRGKVEKNEYQQKSKKRGPFRKKA